MDPRYLELCSQDAFEIDRELKHSLALLEWKTASRTTDKWFEELRPILSAMFNDMIRSESARRGDWQVLSNKVTRRRVSALTNFQPRLIDCCINSCCAFVDKQDGDLAKYADLDACPLCHQARYEVVTIGGRQVRRSRKTYSYIPLIPRLLLQYADAERASTLKNYRASLLKSNPNNLIRDYFDGAHFASMRQQFSDPRTLAFSLSTDGITFVKQKGFSTWPILMQNLSLPPAERVKYENMILIGLIPGPKNCKDIDSFLVPLLEELQQLVKGVPAFDASEQEEFTLKGYLCIVSGDTPAIAKLMCMSGHNSVSPCRFCKIRGVYSSRNRHQYYPHTDVGTKVSQLRMRINMKRDYIVVNGSGSRAIRKKSGINGLPILLGLEGKGLSFPDSFGQDAMHLVSNVTSLMFSHWSGKLDSKARYVIPDKVWAEIGEEQVQCRRTLPSVICRTPRSIAVSHKSYKTKEWETWLFIFSLPLLRGRLWGRAYAHWAMFVRAMTLLFQKELAPDEIDYAERLLEIWVRQYEEIYYGHGDGGDASADRLSACRGQIHGLLHLPQNTRVLGPLFCYWQYPVERYIGQFERLATSRSQLNASLVNNLIQRENLNYLRYKYQSLTLPSWKGNKRPGLVLPLDLPDTQGAYLIGPRKQITMSPSVTMAMVDIVERPLSTRKATIYSRLSLPHLRYDVGSYQYQHRKCLRLSCYVELLGWHHDEDTGQARRSIRYARVERLISYDIDDFGEVWTVAEIRWLEHEYDDNVELSFIVGEREMGLVAVDSIARVVGVVSSTVMGDKPKRNRSINAITDDRTKLWIVGPDFEHHLVDEEYIR